MVPYDSVIGEGRGCKMRKTVLALAYFSPVVLHTLKHRVGCYRPARPCVLPRPNPDSVPSQMAARFCQMGLVLLGW